MTISRLRSRPHVAAVVLALLVPGLALAKLERAGDAQVTFTAAGPAGLKIEGKTSELQVDDQNDTLHIKVPLGNLDTGIALRNKHMREKYLEVGKFPTADLAIARKLVTFPSPNQPTQATAPGTLTLHGVSKPVTFTYGARREGELARVDGSMHLNIKDFNIDVPSYLGVTVKPDVDVTVRFVARGP